MAIDIHSQRVRLAREFAEGMAGELSQISFRIDELIGRNSTNQETRTSLREIRESISALITKSSTLQGTHLELTLREIEILQLLPSGLTAKAMAEQIFISEATLKTHLAAIYRKLAVPNRVQAIEVGNKRGLIPKKN